MGDTHRGDHIRADSAHEGGAAPDPQASSPPARSVAHPPSPSTVEPKSLASQPASRPRTSGFDQASAPLTPGAASPERASTTPAIPLVHAMPSVQPGQRLTDGSGLPAPHSADICTPLAHEAKLVLYERALHPSLFAVHARRFLSLRLQGRTWDAELWMLEGGHVALFGHRATAVSPAWWASEVVAPSRAQVPLSGVARAVAIPHERDLELRFGLGGVIYLCSMQCERFSPAAYASELDDQSEFARKEHALAHPFTTLAGQGLSVVDMRRVENSLALTAFHLLPLGGGYGVSVRTQAMFEVG